MRWRCTDPQISEPPAPNARQASTATAVRTLPLERSPVIVVWEELTVLCAADPSQTTIRLKTEDPLRWDQHVSRLQAACHAPDSEQDQNQQGRQDSRYQQRAKATHPVRVKGEHLFTPLPWPLSHRWHGSSRRRPFSCGRSRISCAGLTRLGSRRRRLRRATARSRRRTGQGLRRGSRRCAVQAGALPRAVPGRRRRNRAASRA